MTDVVVSLFFVDNFFFFPVKSQRGYVQRAFIAPLFRKEGKKRPGGISNAGYILRAGLTKSGEVKRKKAFTPREMTLLV